MLEIGDWVEVLQDSTADVTFAADGVTIGSMRDKLTTNRQFSKVRIQCVASGQIRLFGDLAFINLL